MVIIQWQENFQVNFILDQFKIDIYTSMLDLLYQQQKYIMH